jgi:hypothetical protein
MPQQPIHIISFDNPYPPVYGGAIDVFFKLRALHALGFEIYLHCFVDKLPREILELERYTAKVYFYERRKKGHKLLAVSPFSVASRYHDAIAKNISEVDAPLLFEGLQSTYLLKKHTFPDRQKFLRLMNLESNYFGGLGRSERHPVKKILFAVESVKYALYQKIIGRFNGVFTLSVYETQYVQKHYRNAHYVPVFHGSEQVAQLSGFGKYAFYHGDLRMSDNRRAALFLIKVFRKIPDYRLIIASNRGKRLIKKEIKNTPNIEHTAIKNQQHLDELMHEAHISVMLSFQQSGTKLKSVNSLYKSRHCIINGNMVDDAQIRSLCTMAETQTDFIAAVNQLKSVPYRDFEKRKKVLDLVLNDLENAKKIAAVINQNP